MCPRYRFAEQRLHDAQRPHVGIAGRGEAVQKPGVEAFTSAGNAGERFAAHHCQARLVVQFDIDLAFRVRRPAGDQCLAFGINFRPAESARSISSAFIG